MVRNFKKWTKESLQKIQREEQRVEPENPYRGGEYELLPTESPSTLSATFVFLTYP